MDMMRPSPDQQVGSCLDPEAVETWIFDLDNTLYPASTGVFDQIDRRIGRCIQDLLDLSAEEARSLQKTYLRRHGSTLRGLMIHHDVNPHEFLDYVHAIDVTPLDPNPPLARALEDLPGRRLIFTSASTRHATRVTDRLGITSAFDGVFDIHAADYRPKPDPDTYLRMVAALDVEPTRAVFFEDIARNLAPAAALGMATVWISGDNPFGREGAEGDHIHHVAEDLVAWLEALWPA
jgi:putative hydrolase of the HAD superfamily